MKPEVAILVNCLRVGGVEKQSLRRGIRLAERGYPITLLHLDATNEVKSEIPPQLPVVNLDKKFYIDPLALGRLVRFLAQRRPSVLLCVNGYSMLYGYLASELSGHKPHLLMSLHSTILQGVKEKALNQVYRRLMNRMEKVIFVSKVQQEYWIENYSIEPDLCTVIYNGVDTKRYHPGVVTETEKQKLRSRLGIAPDDIVVVVVAAFRPEKKHELIIDATSRLVREGYPIKLLLVGDGPERKKIEDYALVHGEGEHVTITGQVDNVADHLSAAHISALSSITETFSNAVLESMAMAKPMVMPDIGGAREQVIDGQNGYIYPPGDVDMLTEAIRKIIDDGAFERMGAKSLEMVTEFFTEEKMVDQYAHLLDMVTNAD